MEFINLLDDDIFELDEYGFCVRENLEDQLDDLPPFEQISAYLKQLHE